MPRNPNPDAAARQLLVAFRRLPPTVQVVVFILLLVAGLVYVLSRGRSGPEPSRPAETTAAGEQTVLFCVWNLENLFDDRDDARRPVDEEYDNWFARNPADRQQKYDKLAEWLVRQNGGRGPDILVGIEVESYRAADLLRQALNARLAEGVLRYEHVAMQELDAGRHIAPCVISRWPLDAGRLLGNRLRILEVRVTANGHELVVIASHWTSQKTDDGSTPGSGRARYAAVIAEAYARHLRANPKADVVVCGDFNDTPEADVIVQTLGMVADPRLVTPEAWPPRLLGLLSDKSPEQYGTHYYNRPLIYDHIAVSPGLLDDEGWSYVADSVRVPTDGLIRFGSRARRPWRFGSPGDDALGRGYSDHFPVLARFRVAP